MLNPLSGVVVGGRYLLVRPLAKGGMGSVWVARHRDLDVDVSVKFMEPSLLANAELRARFEREAKVAARLNSRHIVKVLDYGADDGMPYIAMELLRGESLADRIAREGRLSVDVTRHILGQVCRALRMAHADGLVHRDLKPGNIFLAHEDHEEVVKVLDFGIVKETGTSEMSDGKVETATGLAMGSVHYMSPEQIRSSRSVDVRSDLWSVGVILYKMLTGDVPFPGTAHGDVMVRVCTDPLVPPSFVVPGLPKEMDAFFARALTRDPAGRYQSAEEFAAAFDFAASLVPSDELVQGSPTRGGMKTIKLPRMPFASQPSIQAVEGSVVQTQPLPQQQRPNESSFVSAVLEKTAGTFQAVTMPKAEASAARAEVASPPTASLRVPRALVGVAVFVAVVSAGLVSVVASRWGAGKGEPPSTGASAVPSNAIVPPPSTETRAAMVPTSSAIPMGSVSSSLSAAPKQQVTSGQTAVRTSPSASVSSTATTSPRPSVRNPLDIAD